MKTEYPITPHYDGNRFYNEDRTAGVPGLGEVLKWQITKKSAKWPELVSDNVKPELTHNLSPRVAAATYVNHASELIQLQGMTILTDPLFSERTSPLSFAGPKRHRQTGLKLSDLPQIDVVLVSHNHYDHMDIASLKIIHQKHHPKFIVPLANKEILDKHGIDNIDEIDWWKSVRLRTDSVITCVPMQHWSSRGPTDRFKALWGGFVIEHGPLKILFAGDTGYGPQFKEIEKRFGPMDFSLLPIGAYEPRWFMKTQHMNPEDAVRAHQDLKSKLSQGIHFGTFQLTDEGMEEPVTELKKCLLAAGIPESSFIAPKNGQTTVIKN